MYSSSENKLVVKNHSIIDVTLRDGGFGCNFNWSIEEMAAIVAATSSAPVKFVEVGYIGGLPDLHNVMKPGFAATLTNSSIQALRQYVLDAGISVMVHPGAISNSINFEELKFSGVDLVRFVYHESWKNQLTQLHQAAKTAGLKSSINIALLSHLSINELLTIVEQLSNGGHTLPDIICLADTCGAMFPERVFKVVNKCVNATTSMIGFHAHDYLSLAAANTLSAVSAGAKIVDASLLGIGRGAGNLRLELWESISQLHLMKDIKIKKLDIAYQVIKNRVGMKKIPDLISILCGSLNLKPPEEDFLRSKCEKTDQAVFCQAFFELLQECVDVDDALHKI